MALHDAGQNADPETGLIYMRARYYDPATAQFLTRDPITAITRQRYSYVYHSLLNRTDPSGLDPSNSGGPPSSEDVLGAMNSPGCVRIAGGPVSDAPDQRGSDRYASGYGQIAARLGYSVRQVRDAIHAVKKRGRIGHNVDVAVDRTTSEIYPVNADGSLGDSIGNIHDELEASDGGGMHFHLTPTNVIVGVLFGGLVIATGGATAPVAAAA